MVAEFKTIAKPSEGVFKDKGSTFLGFAFHITDEAEFKARLQEIKKAHHKCNHHCYAFRLKPDGSHFRSSDDREPSGSAGKPILGQLLSNELTDSMIVVARYFGGSLLGVSGLIHAYRSAAADAIANAVIETRTVNALLTFTFPYPLLNDVMILLKAEKHKIIGQHHGEMIVMNVELPVLAVERLLQKIRNTALAEQIIVRRMP